MGKPAKDGRGTVIRFEVNGVGVRLTIPPDDGGRPALPESMLPFSHTETRVLRLLLANGPLSREEVAGRLDESIDGRLKGILAGLVARRVLRVMSEGYAIGGGPADRERLQAVVEATEQEDGPAATKPDVNGRHKGRPVAEGEVAGRAAALREGRLDGLDGE